MGSKPGIQSLPDVAEGSVFFGAGLDSGVPDAKYGGNRIDVYFIALDVQTGKEKWKYDVAGEVYSQSAIDAENV